ncbi:Alpha/Beta hydrolase protein [Lipomyces chichibuensis]|uniref:Alpha/Beta hydrolase protein n=1 Tax=Lipomyces chichibuensis TaxID=1546026 RepID=UPI0033439F0E
MPLPLLGRLKLREWPPLIFGLCLVILESILRFVTSCLPSPIIVLCEDVTKRMYAKFVPTVTKERTIVQEICSAGGFVDICEIYGYRVEEHIVKTTDGYLLGVHRIYQSKREVANEVLPKGKPIVYLHHGLLMNSEVWVCLTDPKRCLPFLLVERGYDVWLGNNRGNKYSKKHVFLQSTESAFWNFSMDEFALYDIPDTIDYILSTTCQKNLAYIGFSQGSAQAFAALSLHPGLNDKVKVFVALAPAMAPGGLSIGIVDALIKASPTIMFFFFGRKAILSSAIFWQSIMYPPLFVRLIDRSLIFLFNWHGKHISFHQKVAAYAHLYSFASVKTVVHWFQIMRHSCFQMFDDEPSSPVRLYGQAFYKVAQFPTRNIRSPIYLMYGTADSLVDIDAMLKELPRHAVAIPVEDHEHLDIIWGKDVQKIVIPQVLNVLEKYLSVPVSLVSVKLNVDNFFEEESKASSWSSSSTSICDESNKARKQDGEENTNDGNVEVKSNSVNAECETLDSDPHRDLDADDEDEERVVKRSTRSSSPQSFRTVKSSSRSPVGTSRRSMSQSPPPKKLTFASTGGNFSSDGIVLGSSGPVTAISMPGMVASRDMADSVAAHTQTFSPSTSSAAAMVATGSTVMSTNANSNRLQFGKTMERTGELISSAFRNKGRTLFGDEKEA